MTGKPIEGAVVLIEWTITKGMGLSHTKSHKVIEAVTDENGNFTIMGSLNPFANEPHITIYKKNYVAWNNRIIFPGHKKREFKWKDGYEHKLEKFKSTYSYNNHNTFMNSAGILSMASNKKKLFNKAIEWEVELAFSERRAKNNY